MKPIEQKRSGDGKSPLFRKKRLAPVHLTRPFVVSLLLVQVVLLVVLNWRTAPNQTEVGHMGAAVYLWNAGKFDVYHVNPPLVRAISGLPVVLCGPRYDWTYYSTSPANRCEWNLGVDFVEANSPDDVHWYFFLARCACTPLVVLGGYVGYRFAGELYGPASGFVFLLMWVFSPSILAWGATICPDVAAASLGALGLYAFWKWLKRPSWITAIVAGALLGLMPLAKLTWIVAFGLWPLIWYVWRMCVTPGNNANEAPARDQRANVGHFKSSLQLAVVLLAGFYILNLGYGFDGTFRSLREYRFASAFLRGAPPLRGGDNVSPGVGNRFSESLLGYLPVPLPKEFVQGMDTQAVDFERGKQSYLRGEYSDRGWWYYYAYSMIVKEPLGVLLLLAMSVAVSGFWRRCCTSSPRDEAVVVLVFVFLFLIISSQTGFSIHSRYVIPTLPFLYIAISKIGGVLGQKPCLPWPSVTRVSRGLTVLLIGWTIAASMAVYPHSMSYFNELAAVLPTSHDPEYPKPIARGSASKVSRGIWAGPYHGPRHLLGSNIEWGQDLSYLKRWLDSHPYARPVRIAYWDSYPLRLNKIESVGLPPAGPEIEEIARNADPESVGPVPGWYALSVNCVYGRDRRYRYFLYFNPITSAGYSIYIYHITLDDANRVYSVN